MDSNFIHPADQLIMFMQRIYDKGLTTTSGGNLSIMDSDGNIWITPASVDKGSLSRKDVICVHPDGSTEGIHRPSSEFPFHASVYKMRPDLKAVFHAHPPALVAFSIVRKIPNFDLVPTVRNICKEARIAVYGVPGSLDLGNKVGAAFADNVDIAILENHGICLGGPDMFAAFQRFETLNYAAELQIKATKLGGIRVLSESQITKAEASVPEKMDSFVPSVRTSEELTARRDMITMIRRSYRMGLFTSTHGTYSIRLSDGSILITPFGMDRNLLDEKDLVLVQNGKAEEGKTPSRAIHFHEKIYENNPEVRSVIQAKPVNAMAFAVADAQFDPRTIPESYILLRAIKKIPFDQLYDDPVKTSKEFGPADPALMIENDSVITTGDSLLQAFDRLEVMDTTAHSIINSLDIGQIVHIAEEEVDKLKVAFNLKD